jgi:hypothetical protein
VVYAKKLGLKLEIFVSIPGSKKTICFKNKKTFLGPGDLNGYKFRGSSDGGGLSGKFEWFNNL